MRRSVYQLASAVLAWHPVSMLLTRTGYRIFNGQIEPFDYELHVSTRGAGIAIDGWLEPGRGSAPVLTGVRDALARDVRHLVTSSCISPLLPGKVSITLPDAHDSPGLAMLLAIELEQVAKGITVPRVDVAGHRVGWGALTDLVQLVPARGVAALGHYLAERGGQLVTPVVGSRQHEVLTSESGLALYEVPSGFWLRQQHRVGTSLPCPYWLTRAGYPSLDVDPLPPPLVCVAIELAAAFGLTSMLWLSPWKARDWKQYARQILPPLEHERARALALQHWAVGAEWPVSCRTPVRAPAADLQLLQYIGTRERAGEFALAHGGLLLLDALASRVTSAIVELNSIRQAGSVLPDGALGVPVPAHFGVVAHEGPCGCLTEGLPCLCEVDTLTNKHIGGAQLDADVWVSDARWDDALDHSVVAARERVGRARGLVVGERSVPALLRVLYGDAYPHTKVASLLRRPGELTPL